MSMIPQSELVACKECGVVFWTKARRIKTAGEKVACPNCDSQETDRVDRSS
jgi:hypothetical protein